MGEADGLCDHRERVISVSDELALNGQVGVLIHELAHALIGRGSRLPHTVEEVVVEAIAYLGCAVAGLDTSATRSPTSPRTAMSRPSRRSPALPS